ncbi:MAG: hypothetical protein HY287_12780 [Planctomycetes bacterium]|nr:hypothetical protein [Planctomycetota bacterium]MBI3835198.1 hypothetical protein [Planctomycetota bacterium]
MSKQEVIDAAREALDFLVSEKAFVGTDSDEKWYLTTLRYTCGNIGIEAELDWHERAAFLLLVRLQNGIWPKGYYVDDGKTCRVHLGSAVRHYAWPVSLPFVGNAGAATDQRMITAIKRDAEILREVLDRILENNVDLFEQVRQNRFR